MEILWHNENIRYLPLYHGSPNRTHPDGDYRPDPPLTPPVSVETRSVPPRNHVYPYHQEKMAQAQGPQGAPPLILPPARDGKTAEQITDAILGLKCIPTYYDVDRAWVVLGYFRSDKPTLQDFVRNTQDLWSFHVRQNWSRRASQARAYILDALRTMGFVSPHWKVNTRNLFLVEEDSDGRYATLGDPPKRPPRVFKDGREYIQAQAPDASGNSETLARHLESRQWLRFHRYQVSSAVEYTGR